MTDAPTPEEAVIESREGAVAVLRLNNPAQLNALTLPMIGALKRAVERALADPEVRAILLTGEGRGFCAGAQLGGEVFASGASIAEGMRAELSPLILALREGPKPVVCAVNGPAAGAGVGIALAGDVVIAARSAKFLLSFGRLGAALDGGTSALVQRLAGAAKARGMAMLARPIAAEEAERWGMIWSVVDDEALAEEAMAAARALASGPPLSLATIKRQLREGWTADLARTLDAEAGEQAILFQTEDLREGAAAFVER
ncbi:enoyl-CoA hydratase-related protein, partial [uncultured Albimonas sp.]|uniref:enoyl-CoA hydratase/isomerase family protein n=1 Tax=uncultured Albimonas sp. TaxID=1331701 RepID=UPI0030EE43DE